MQDWVFRLGMGIFNLLKVAGAPTQENDPIKNQISKRTFHGNKIKIFKDNLHAA